MKGRLYQVAYIYGMEPLQLCIVLSLLAACAHLVCSEETSHLFTPRENSSHEASTGILDNTCSKMPYPFLVKESPNKDKHTFIQETAGDTHSMGESRTRNDIQEFKCPFQWDENGGNKLRDDILDWMRHRQKSFIRFTIPVMGYTNRDTSMYNYTGLLTWVWVLTKHEYMLHYPHNFIRISAGTMGIITDDWALDYDRNTVPVSLGNFSFDIDDDYYEYRTGVGYCESQCIEVNKSCGIGKHDLVKFLSNLTEHDCEDCPYEWELVCLQLPYEDITSVLNSHPNFIGPDVFYYMLFIKKLFAEALTPTVPLEKHSFEHQYRCYKRADLSASKRKELMESYFVIPLIALGMWLYIPLLIHYFPSSSVTHSKAVTTPVGMFPSHKSPNYFGRYLRSIFCFYPPNNSRACLVRLRRLVFLLVVFLSPARLFLLQDYGKLLCVIATVLIAASLLPRHISTHFKPDTKFELMGWKIPPSLTRINIDLDLKEYQLLAALMQERVYLIIDCRFWVALINDFCFERFRSCSNAVSFWSVVTKALLFIWGLLLLSLSIVVMALCYLIPLLYFLKEMAWTVHRMTSGSSQPHSITSLILSAVYGVLIYTTILCVLVVTFFWCYTFVEVSVFTVIGGAILPSMAFPYFILVGSILGAVYGLVHSLHEDYEKIIEEIISILSSERKIPKAKVFDPWNADLRELVKTECVGHSSSYTISVIVGAGMEKEVMKNSFVTTFLHRELFDYVADMCHPIQRQVLFIILQVVVILFYALIVMWVKNVYHLEAEVDTIFSLVSIVAVAFVPSVLRLFAYKSYFGRKTEHTLRQSVYFALIEFFADLDTKYTP